MTTALPPLSSEGTAAQGKGKGYVGCSDTLLGFVGLVCALLFMHQTAETSLSPQHAFCQGADFGVKRLRGYTRRRSVEGVEHDLRFNAVARQ